MKKRTKLQEMFAHHIFETYDEEPKVDEAPGPTKGSASVMGTGAQSLFSIEILDSTFVVRAKNRGEAIVFLSGIVGKDTITRSRDQLQQHFGPVVQINKGTGDVIEVGEEDLAPAGGPPPVPNKA